MDWRELRRNLPDGLIISSSGEPEAGLEVSGVTLDSRKVQPGNVFAALSGGSTDGHRYIPAAIERGAAVIAGERAVEGLSVPYIQVRSGREALAYLSAAFYGFPARRLAVIGVTGTDGKTTTCNLIYHILRTAGLPAGMISTVNAVIGDEILDTGFHVTTPEAPDVQRYLAQMVQAGLKYVVLESTSHGLEQQRVGACDFDIGVLTNITHEHLDYHGSLEAYRAAKAHLFTGLAETPPKAQGNPRLAVLNRDDSSYEYLLERIDAANGKPGRQGEPIRVVTYGLHAEADLRAEGILYSPNGTRFWAVWEGGRQQVSSALVGEYNVYNCLAALAATILGLNVDAGAAAAGVEGLPPIPGRMEAIDLGQDFMAVVDFAHTPNALSSALQAARAMLPPGGRLIAVFGSAGLRDRAKRGLMAEVSAQLADLTLLTAEDPRTESLAGILGEMAGAMENSGAVEGVNFWRVPDRGDALRQAVSMARPGDLVIALGKGHEQSMCFGDIEYAWDDRVAMRAALAERLQQAGLQMPKLPTSSSD